MQVLHNEVEGGKSLSLSTSTGVRDLGLLLLVL